ncbi:hypothetical protein IGI04_001896 [Brassica rapa subsp. trilocularis]|uniref:SHSP domain-containing protein n=1 Tax=Brassica rapa subsp. trilocularis TaxID=1813537 RepID=A0ABQ7NX91_BRACM|nr:hypothetical protein IGI04_001896 [Brassica rapa subsp. trilocularis]
MAAVPEGYYESTNPFLVHGPRGFEEFKLLEGFGMYVRMDFPGVPEECVRISLDPAKKSLAVYADAPKVHRYDLAQRKYLSVIETVCRCCVFDRFTYQMSDGVLRLHLSKSNIDPRRSSCIEFKYSAFGEDISGNDMDDSYESKQLEDGNLYVRLDMPGVPKDNFTVSVANGKVNVTGQAPALSHDSGSRLYSADVVMLSGPVDFPSHRVKTIIKNEGFYAINNEFLMNGPKGFQEFKILENDIMFVRMDFPGVPEDGVSVTLDQSKTLVSVSAKAPRFHTHDLSHRNYFIITGLGCGCCEISGFTYHMTDGVLRLHLSKTNILHPQLPSCTSFLGGIRFKGDGDLSGCPHRLPYNRNPYHPALTGPVLMRHPNVAEGTAMAYESKQLENGSLYVRLDMPGVPKDNFNVSVSSGKVKVTGQAPAVSHDSDGRFYSGDVAMLSAPVDVPSRPIKTIIKDGVIRLLIPSV